VSVDHATGSEARRLAECFWLVNLAPQLSHFSFCILRPAVGPLSRANLRKEEGAAP
jgi:hypothetical protein